MDVNTSLFLFIICLAIQKKNQNPSSLKLRKLTAGKSSRGDTASDFNKGLNYLADDLCKNSFYRTKEVNMVNEEFPHEFKSSCNV